MHKTSLRTPFFLLACLSGGLVTPSAQAQLAINPTFDSSITTHPKATTIMNSIKAALLVYKNAYSNPITVNIYFEGVNSGLGSSSTYIDEVSYSDFRAALKSHATTSDDTAALTRLPNTTNNPVNGNKTMVLSLPNMRVLGLSTYDPPDGFDSTVSLNLSIMNFDRVTVNPKKYDIFSTVWHEVNEVLGFSSGLNQASNDPITSPTDPISVLDIFRYDAAGHRTYTTNIDKPAYFTLNGTTLLARFNQDEGGDRQDFFSDNLLTRIAQVQDAFGYPGDLSDMGVELRMLDIIGYTPKSAVSEVAGHITLLNCLTPTSISLALTFTPQSGAVVNRVALLNSTGAFSVSVPAGNYTLRIKGAKWLQKKMTVNATANVTNLAVNLIPGDANNDNHVNIFDLATLANDFNTAPGDANWNGGRSDFNCDDNTDIFDLATLAAYFNTDGDL